MHGFQGKPFAWLLALLLTACQATTPISPAEGSGTWTPEPSPSPGQALAVPRHFDVEGHRGARGLKPENTLPAFETALDLGVTTLELDLHLTADDVLVIWHDHLIKPNKCRLDPMPGGPQAPDPDDPSVSPQDLWIRHLTYAQVRQYRCDRNPNPDRFPLQDPGPTALAGDDYRIPRLEDLFDFVERYAAAADKPPDRRENAARVQFDMETKRRPDLPETIGDGFNGRDPGLFERLLVQLIQDRGLVERSIVQSFDHRSLWAVRRLDPAIRLSALARAPMAVKPLAAQGAAIYSPRGDFLTPSVVQEAHAQGLLVIPWTVNDPQEMRRYIEWGVDGLISDRPDLVLDLIRREP